ncbi:MAG: anaerobic ribonucleoside-triphosphate reductase activating protein [Thermodesulfobacteriota bacterium]
MIEIKGFLETSFVDWKGKICSVLFLPRCNFRCPYCHNHPLVLNPEQFESIPLQLIFDRLKSFRQWIDGICLTGGEPTIHSELPSMAREIKKRGFLVKLDTNGSHPQMLERLIEEELIDFVSMDIKAPLDPLSYQRSTGVSVNLNSLWRSIEILKEGKIEYEFRVTVVPQLHSKTDLLNLGKQLRPGSRIVLQNFNPENPMDPSLKKTSPYDPKILKEIEKTLQEMG